MASNGDSTNEDLADWMSKLPVHLLDTPLSELAIPGSHDSFSFSLDPHSEIAPGVHDTVRKLGPLAKPIVYKWSVTQTLDFKQQLSAGIRYFDMRVATRKNSDRIHFVHGLYGMLVEDGLKQIVEYLKEHRKEIVIVDFNHFYNMDETQHAEFLEVIKEVCGEMLCLNVGVESLSVNMLWEQDLQIVVVYHHQTVEENAHFWYGRHCINAPWANTSATHSLIDCIDCGLKSRPNHAFHVTQGVLTPDTSYILKNMMSSIQSTMAGPAMTAVINWLKTKQRQRDKINIVIADFIELQDFVRVVVSMNNE